MALQDFIGTWSVYLTARTPFGYGASITIEVVDDVIVVGLSPSDGAGLQAEYLEDQDLLQITGITHLKQLVFARYTDPDPDIDYNAIYGVGLAQGLDTSERLAVCTAIGEPGIDAQVTTSGEPQTQDEQRFKAKVTAGSQFGLGSTLVLEGDPLSLAITDALGSSMPIIDNMRPVGSGWSLQGLSERDDGIPRIVVQCSFVTLDETLRTFGMAAIGDPENSGTWGGDAEGAGTPTIMT